MARIDVELPDDLADAVREAGLDVSAIAEEALRTELAAHSVSAWLEALAKTNPVDRVHVRPSSPQDALSAAYADLWGDG